MRTTLADRLRQAYSAWAGKVMPRIEDTTERMKKDAFGYVQDRTQVATNRLGMYAEYAQMLSESKLAERAVKAHADTCVTGGVVDEQYELEVEGNSAAKKVCEEIENKLDLHNMIWRYAYEMIAYGDLFCENICDVNGPLYLKMLPRNTISLMVGPDGRIPIVDAYIQGDGTGRTEKFDLWEIMHLNAGQLSSNQVIITGIDPYGANFALLKGARRSFKQLRMAMDSVLVRRVSRAPMRFKYSFDTGPLNPEQAWDYVLRRKAEMKKNRFVDENGKLILDYNPMLEEDDFWIYKSETLKNTDVEVLQGDSAVSDIADIDLLLKLFLGDLDTPKPLLGFEEGTQTRATLSGLDIQFARTVRRWQQALSAGLRLPFYTGLMLKKINPQDVQLSLRFPPIGTADEIFLMEADKLRADVTKMLAIDVGLDITWVLKRMFKLPDDEIAKIIENGTGPITPASNVDEVQVEQLLNDFFKVQKNRDLFRDAQSWRR
jgi:hypothetical protein